MKTKEQKEKFVKIVARKIADGETDDSIAETMGTTAKIVSNIRSRVWRRLFYVETAALKRIQHDVAIELRVAEKR